MFYSIKAQQPLVKVKIVWYYQNVFKKKKYALIAQLVEQVPFKDKVAGSSPAGRTFVAILAQLVEQLFCKQQVVGPSPTDGSEIKTENNTVPGFLSLLSTVPVDKPLISCA